ncbi:methyltransferase domain-containing protein [Haloarcula nitratireducens]|uniref:Arsenite methyltransferase n=1 Tax=Haloarcula nitratireducens TaxID=2487749 RepID=A0AAW4PG27_9EURY|nr:methyltransferase domain-containing protein [Halomicroarcula nitratireducens]MBX0296828.1 methyltransferase domain-containing protein [Halomicroarcula nitratireducens]
MQESLDVDRLERAVKSVYRDVAKAPTEEYHFEMGRPLAEQLGYPAGDLDTTPEEVLESFAGVGYHFDLAALEEGDDVLDLGSGSGTDVFVAARHVGDTGSVTGLDMTDEQLAKARQLRDEAGIENVFFERGYIEELPFDDETFDVVLSNGVINLSPDKQQVFTEAKRVLTAGGRLAISDIISEKLMPESIKNNEDLWAACIGGAEQIDRYTALIEGTGFDVDDVRDNTQYEFLSEQAATACQKYGVKSISLGAHT